MTASCCSRLEEVNWVIIHKFSIEHNMKLNPKKCKEMLINFMQNDNFTTRPIVLGNNTVECVTSYKLLGIIKPCLLQKSIFGDLIGTCNCFQFDQHDRLK